jgi:transcriptional regulator with XRE-family HTH domain
VEGDLQRALGRQLRSYRLARDLSQEAFADVLGYHRTYVGAMERGNKNLSLRAVERIAESLDIDPLLLLQPLDTESTSVTTTRAKRRQRHR